MNNKYSYIGSFDISSGTIDIVDPYINSLSVKVEKIPVANEKMVKIRRVLNGVYDAFHIVNNEDGIIKSLFVIHESYNMDSVIRGERYVDMGYTSSALSGAIVLVDERYRQDSENCYYSIESDAYYEGETILEKLSEMPYSEDIKDGIRKMVQEKMGMGSHPKGSDIIEILKEEVVWNGFSSFGIHSSHWSTDVINRVRHSHVNGTAIKGGVACNVRYPKGGYHKCSCYFNSLGDAYAINVDLLPIDII